MQIGITGSEDRLNAWKLLNGENTNWTWVQDSKSAKIFDLFIDLNFDFNPENIQDYSKNTQTIFLLSAVNSTPEQALLNSGLKYQGENFFGINAIPTFLERKTIEYSNPFQLNEEIVQNAIQPLIWDKLEKVNSRIGMITPRIVFMIINEAYYTFQEGTAAKEDIDIAMKLGTNYPKGPFEWCKQAGLDNVYKTLYAIYEDTKDERYKICPALKSEWIQSQI